MQDVLAGAAEVAVDDVCDQFLDDQLSDNAVSDPRLSDARLSGVGLPGVGLPDIELPDCDSALQLPAILDLKAAGGLAAALIDRRGADIVVDASAVQRLGGQCLQILLSAQSSWAEDGFVMRIADASAEFYAAIELFGAGSAFSLSQKAIH